MAIVSALLTLASCAPQAFLIKPEMRAASKSGLNFNGKSMAVVYITDDDNLILSSEVGALPVPVEKIVNCSRCLTRKEPTSLQGTLW